MSLYENIHAKRKRIKAGSVHFKRGIEKKKKHNGKPADRDWETVRDKVS